MTFSHPNKLRKHCLDHLREFGLATCAEYERIASEFLTQAATESLHQCIRSRGDTVRYDSATQEFGIATIDGFIRTYFKPEPAVHGLESNMAYFHRECSTH